MASFTDTEGKTWEVSITVGTIKRVKSLADIDLGTILSKGYDELSALIEDPVQLADVLFAVCKPEADKVGITDEQFGERLVGDVIFEGATALMEGLVDFFPKHQSETLKLAMKTMMMMREKALRDLKSQSPESLYEIVTSSQESSESTPRILPSAS